MLTKTARLTIEADSRQLKTAGRDLQGFERQAARTQRAAASLSKVIGGVAAAFAGGFITRSVIQNTIRQEQAIAQLDAALLSTGNAIGYTRDQLTSMAAELQKVSTFGDEAIIEAQARLVTYTGIVGTNFPRALQSVIDQSTRLNISLEQSAEIIGRALESPIKAAAALSQQGFGAAFTEEVKSTIKALVDQGKEAEAQVIILKILEEAYGGAAKAARGTLGGAIKSLQNAFGDLLEGDSGGEGIRGATQAINDLTDTLNDPDVKAGFQTIVAGILDIIRFGTQLIPVLGFIKDEIKAAFGSISEDDVVRIGDLVARQKEAIAELERLRSQVRAPGQQQRIDAQLAAAREELARLEGRYQRALGITADRLKKTAAAQLELRAASGGGDIKPPKVEPPDTRAFDAIQRQIEALQFQVATFGQSESQVTLYKLAVDGATESQLAQARSILQTLDVLQDLDEAQREAQRTQEELERRGAQIYEQTRTAAERLTVQIEELDLLLEKGVITWDTYSRALTQAGESFLSLAEDAEATKTELDLFAENAAKNIQSAFADFLFDPFKDGLDGMLKGFGQTIQRMIAEAVAADLARRLFGSYAQGGEGVGLLGGALSAIGGFFGLKNQGGVIPAGKWAIAGEKGPEIVRGPATVTSTAETARSASKGNTFVFNMPGITNAREAREAQGTMARAVMSVIRQSERYA